MNIVIGNSKWHKDDINSIYANMKGKYDEPILFTTEEFLPNLLVSLGFYKSTSQARQAKREGKIPDGYTELKATKTDIIYIWNPNTDLSFKDSIKYRLIKLLEKF